MKIHILLTVVLILEFPCVVQGVLMEDWLISTLLQDYNKLAYPGTTDNATVVVKHDMTLIRIVEFDGTKLTIDAWLGTEWRDPRFLWDSSPINIRLPISLIWTPDIVLYDNPDTRLRFEPNAVIDQSGLVYYCQPIRLEVDNCRQFRMYLHAPLSSAHGHMMDLKLIYKTEARS
ncbi:CHRNA7 [Mytilus edulis]|uniref:CHRNA7 n=1 Tax=Mytilus edulis TaxID=6550 RepID=A0A8S3RLC1_MYTED|nr:CHRNA7 [Mytilus edulis]